MDKREMWNDSIGLILCIVGLVGIAHDVSCSGWLIFFGFLFFCESSTHKEKQ